MADEEVAVAQLFGFWPSPFSRRVELALKLKGVQEYQYQYIEEDVVNKKSDVLLQYNPIYKRVPVFVHHGKPIAESLVIPEYIEDNWKDNPSLPQDSHQRALARFWANYIDDKVTPAVLKAARSKGEEIEKAVEEAQEALEPLENELKSLKFFGGVKIGFVDIVGTVVAYWFPAIEEALGIELLRSPKFPNLRKWSQELTNHNLVMEVLPKKDELVAYLDAVFHKKVLSI